MTFETYVEKRKPAPGSYGIGSVTYNQLGPKVLRRNKWDSNDRIAHTLTTSRGTVNMEYPTRALALRNSWTSRAFTSKRPPFEIDFYSRKIAPLEHGGCSRNWRLWKNYSFKIRPAKAGRVFRRRKNIWLKAMFSMQTIETQFIRLLWKKPPGKRVE